MIYTDKLALLGDTEEELHLFVRKLQLNKKHFREETKSYILPKCLIQKAIKRGAKLVKSRDMIDIMNSTYK